MRILDGARLLQEVDLHLTDDEARRLIDALADCRDDIANVGMRESHWHVGDPGAELTVFVYASSDGLEAEVADRMSEET